MHRVSSSDSRSTHLSAFWWGRRRGRRRRRRRRRGGGGALRKSPHVAPPAAAPAAAEQAAAEPAAKAAKRARHAPSELRVVQRPPADVVFDWPEVCEIEENLKPGNYVLVPLEFFPTTDLKCLASLGDTDPSEVWGYARARHPTPTPNPTRFPSFLPSGRVHELKHGAYPLPGS